MRLLLLATDAYGGHGGIALFNRELAAALVARADVEEVVVIPRVVTSPNAHLIPERVTFVDDAAKGALAYTKAIARARSQRFDLVLCGHVNLLPVAFALSRKPVLITHGIEAWQPLRSPLSRALLRRTRAIISVSALTRDRLVAWSHYNGPTFVLPNAVHLEDYGIRARRRDLVERYKLDGKRVLLTVGRLDARERTKGFDEVLDVLPSLPDDVVFMIAGGGTDFERLQKKSLDLGVGNRVIFTGLFDEEDKPDLYNLAHAYVMPSRGEGFGFVFLEALASGVPAIGSRIDGGREALLDGQLGALVDPDDRDELRDAILAALDRKERIVPEKLDFFAFEHFVERVHAIIDRL